MTDHEHHTDNPLDPRLTRGHDDEPAPQADVYLVLSEGERAKEYVRPLRMSYVHTVCGAVTTMSLAISETYARDPHFYGSTYCVGCSMHRPVGEFRWDGTSQAVGS
jgi:hypothetical protein